MANVTKIRRRKGNLPGKLAADALPRQLGRHYLREWRKHRGLSQERLAELTGLSHGAISQLETGTTAYVQDTLEIIAKSLQCHPADLIGRPPGLLTEIDALIRVATPSQQEQALNVLRVLLAPAVDAAKAAR